MLEYTSAGLLLAAIVCAYAAVWLRWRRARFLLAGLPCYPNLPFIGSYLKVAGRCKEEAVMRALADISEKAEETNLPFVAWIGPVPLLMLHKLEDVKIVTNSFIAKPYVYNFMREWLGNGIFTAPVSLWKRTIKLLGGTFSTTIVEGYQEIFDTQARYLVTSLKGEIGKPPFDVLRRHLANTMLEAIIQTALGAPSEISKQILTNEHYAAFTRNLELLHIRTFNLSYHLDFVYRLTPSYREMRKNVAAMHKITQDVIDKKLTGQEENKAGSENPKDSGGIIYLFLSAVPSGIRGKSYLEILLEMRDTNHFLTIEQIKAEIDTLLFGGQETIATTLSFILMVTGQKTYIQDKMYEEIKEIFGDSKRAVQKDDLIRMEYCEAVILETLRLFPSVLLVVRSAERELKIPSCTIPRGAHCGINIWGAGRSWRTWGHDVMEYRPERWLEPGFMNTMSSTILNFSYGRRACIGRKYAMALMKTVLVHLLRDLRFSSNVDLTKLKTDMSVLRAQEGQMVSVLTR